MRYNLSQNQCFVKAGRSESGKGHYWTIHAGCLEEFSSGDYSRRNARRRVRRRVRNSYHPYSYRDPAAYVPMCASSSSAGATYYNRLSPAQPLASPVGLTSSPPDLSGLCQTWTSQPYSQRQRQTWDADRGQLQHQELWTSQYHNQLICSGPLKDLNDHDCTELTLVEHLNNGMPFYSTAERNIQIPNL